MTFLFRRCARAVVAALVARGHGVCGAAAGVPHERAQRPARRRRAIRARDQRWRRKIFLFIYVTLFIVFLNKTVNLQVVLSVGSARTETRGAGGRAVCDGAWHAVRARVWHAAALLALDGGPELRTTTLLPADLSAPLYLAGLPGTYKKIYVACYPPLWCLSDAVTSYYILLIMYIFRRLARHVGGARKLQGVRARGERGGGGAGLAPAGGASQRAARLVPSAHVILPRGRVCDSYDIPKDI